MDFEGAPLNFCRRRTSREQQAAKTEWRMATDANEAHSMTARTTFTAVSLYHCKHRSRHAITIEAVSVTDGKIGTPKSIDFFQYAGAARSGVGMSFDEVFSTIERQIADRNTPVVGWGPEPGKLLESLIEEHGIDIEYPIRYFDLQNSARHKMGDATARKWQAVAAKLNVDARGKRFPSAVDCANIHLKLEQNDYRLVVARAFLVFIQSIMYDPHTPNAIDTTEAKGLQAFLSVLTNDFKQFKNLKDLVDKVLDDDVVEDYESKGLMDELKKLECEYMSLVNSKNESMVTHE